MSSFQQINCIFCNENSEFVNISIWHRIYVCPTCGVFIYNMQKDIFSFFDKEKEWMNYPSYLFYHKIDKNTHSKIKRNYIGDIEDFNNYIKNVSDSPNDIKYNVITDEIVSNFSNKKLQEKENFLLRNIYERKNEINDITEYSINEICSAAFVIRQRDFADNYMQFSKILKDLQDNKLIEVLHNGASNDFVRIKITTKGIKLIEEGESKMNNTEQSIQKQIILGVGSTYVEEINGNNNTIGTVNNSGIDFDSIISLVDKIESICNENKDNKLQPEIIESINDNLSDIRSYISHKNESGIIKGLKTIRGLLMSASISIAANILTPEIQTMITSLKNCIGA